MAAPAAPVTHQFAQSRTLRRRRHRACSLMVDANEHIHGEAEVKLKSAMMTGALACALGLVAPQLSQAQGATPSSGGGQSQVGNGNGVPSSPGTQGTTDRAGQTPQVPN